MRARYPDREGRVAVDGVGIHFEVHGGGDPTVLLLPTWMAFDARFWKMPVPYLARHFRVITYDPPGNGRSDRPLDPRAHGMYAHLEYTRAVLDVTGTDRAVLVGLSQGGEFGISFAATHPQRVLGCVFIASSVAVADKQAVSDRYHFIREHFEDPYPSLPRSGVPTGRLDDPTDWTKYNRQYWIDELEDFAWFFWGQALPEPHSTKTIEDCVGWTLQTTGELLSVEWDAPNADVDTYRAWAAALNCPVMLLHGSQDRLVPLKLTRDLAGLSGADLVVLEGAGHLPVVRDPVRVSLLIKGFIDRIRAGREAAA